MRQRNIRITVRLTEKEHRYLKRLTDQTGLKIEPVVRSLIMGTELKPRPPVEYADLVRELSAIGNNINQIARMVNTTHTVTPSEIEQAKEYAQQAWELLRERL